jgi:hypothetical protein
MKEENYITCKPIRNWGEFVMYTASRYPSVKRQYKGRFDTQ